MKKINSHRIQLNLRAAAALLTAIILFAASPLMAQPAAARSHTIKAGGQLAQAYVDKKKADYVQRTGTLEALLKLMGGATPAAKTSFNLPEPEQIKVTVRRKAPEKPEIPKGGYFVIDSVGSSGGRVIAANGLTAQAYGLPQHIYLQIRGRIVTPKSCTARVTIVSKKSGKVIHSGISSVRYASVGPKVDLSALLSKGKGGLQSIGITGLEGTNLEFDGVGLKAVSAGNLYFPKRLHYQVRKLEPYSKVNPDMSYDFSAGTCASVLAHGGSILHFGKPVNVKYPKDSPFKSKEVFAYAVKIKNAEFGKTKQVDHFFAAGAQSAGGKGISYRVKTEGKGGDWLRSVRKSSIENGMVNARISGDGPYNRVFTRHGTVIADSDGAWPGANTITASLGDTHAYAKSITLTANRVGRLMMDAPLLTHDQDMENRLVTNMVSRVVMPDRGMENRLAIGMKYNVRMRVTGPANMSRYHVKWEMRQASGKLNGLKTHKSAFKRDGKGWVASAHVRLPDALWDKEEAEMGKVGKRLGTLGRTRGILGSISAAIISPEGHEVYGTYRGNVLHFDTASPGVTYLELLGGYSGGDVKSHTDSDPLDVFIGSQVGPLLSAEVDIQRKKGVQRKRVNLPVGWIRVQRGSGGALGQSRGRIIATGGKPGKAKVRAVIRRADADKAHVGVFFSKGKDSMQSEPLVLSINRPYLIKENGGARYTLMVDGPAKMSRYHAKWSVRVRGKNKTFVKSFLFRAGQAHRSSSIDLASLTGIKQKAFRSGAVSTSVSHVEILNKANQVMARLVVGGGMPVIAPNITLHAVGGAFVQGMEGKITADITTLPAALAKRSVVQWSFGGVLPVAHGKANGKSKTYYKKHDESRLRLAKDGFSSSIVVSYPEDPATAGKVPGVRADLVLKVGKK